MEFCSLHLFVLNDVLLHITFLLKSNWSKKLYIYIHIYKGMWLTSIAELEMLLKN